MFLVPETTPQAAKVVLIDDEAAAKSRSEHEARLFSWLSRFDHPEKLSWRTGERENICWKLYTCTKRDIHWKWIVNQDWDYLPKVGRFFVGLCH